MPLFSRKPHKKLTRFFFATDLHGSERTFRKFVNAGKFYNVDVLVMGAISPANFSFPSLRKAVGTTGPRCKM